MQMFGELTDKKVMDAIRDQHLKGIRGMTMEQRILVVLSDGGWHSSRELSHKVTHRFSDVMMKMLGKGIMWDKRQNEEEKSHWDYRLVDPDAEAVLF